MQRFFKALERGLAAVVRWVVIVLMLAMTGMVFLQVVMRYAFNAPIGWAEELPRFAFVGVSFFGAAELLRLERHIRVTVFFERFPAVVQQVAIFLGHLGALICIGFFVQGGLQITASEWMQLAPASEFPMGWVYLIIPLSAVLMGIWALVHLVRDVQALLRARRP